MKPDTPTLNRETELWQAGYRCIAGIDEAGRGALAGPVVAAAVIVPPASTLDGVWAEVRDSKLLRPNRRVELESHIQKSAWAWGVGMADAKEIDTLGIAPATQLAMQRAVESMDEPPDYLLIDWVRLPHLNVHQESLVKADQTIVSVAAASILAKTARDRYMIELSDDYPDYQFAANKGYGTRGHLDALTQVGPCHVHRFTFAPVANKPSLFDDSATA